MDYGRESDKKIWTFHYEPPVRHIKDILDLNGIENYKHDLMIQNNRTNGIPFILPSRIIKIHTQIREAVNVSFRSLQSYLSIFLKYY